MNRLQGQFHQLYALQASVPVETVRVMVLALRHPEAWALLAPIWQGVQVDWAWPAPAIAVNGHDAFELWFAIEKPTSCDEAMALLHRLCRQYLLDQHKDRLSFWPNADNSDFVAPIAKRIPSQNSATGRWSAFVAPDLAAVFGDDPSLDLPPGDEAQAEVISRIQPIPTADWQRAIASAEPPVRQASTPTTPKPQDDPRRFLLSVMNDATVDMALRVEAAKALLR
jgi:hypothetical protein